MTAYTIFEDATGEIVALVDMPDLQSVQFNTPVGASLMEGWPEHRDCYRLRGRWVKKPIAPTQNHRWDTALKEWVDLRSLETLAQRARAERDGLLAACDWVVARSFEEGEPMPDAWRRYRKGLRDLTTQPTFPLSIDWPTMPS